MDRYIIQRGEGNTTEYWFNFSDDFGTWQRTHARIFYTEELPLDIISNHGGKLVKFDG